MSIEITEASRRKVFIGALAVGICICIFFAYRVLYTAGVSEYAKEFTAGCIGAVITIFATAALLRSQTESEVTKDQLAGMFREKLELYKAFIHFLNSIKKDGEIDSDELRDVVEWGGKLSLVCQPGVIRGLYEYIFQIVAFGSDSYEEFAEDAKAVWRKWMLSHYEGMEADFNDEQFCRSIYSSQAKIITMLRDDLAHKQMADFEENLNMQAILEDLFSLHSVVDIKFTADGEIEIEKFFEQAVKKRARTAR
jgi:hypothetical protein